MVRKAATDSGGLLEYSSLVWAHFMSTGSEEAAEMAERRQEVASTATLAILIGDDLRRGLDVGEAMVVLSGRLCASW